MDWNDLHQARGLDAVREQLTAAVEAANDETLPVAPPGRAATRRMRLPPRPHTRRRGKGRTIPLAFASARATCCSTSG